MKKLLPYLKKYRAYAFLSPVLMILEVLTDVSVPYLMSRIVDVGIATQDINYVVKVGITMIAVALVGMVFGILSAHFEARAGYGFASESGWQRMKRSGFFFC